MTQYQVADTLREEKNPPEGALVLTVVNAQELERQNEALWRFHPRTVQECKNLRMCKAEGYEGYEFVTLRLYRIGDREKKPIKAAFYLLPRQLVLVEEEGRAYGFLQKLVSCRTRTVESSGELLCELLEELVCDDFLLLERLEGQISALEDLVLGETLEDFEKRMMKTRKTLLRLHSSYERLMNLSQELEENQNEILTPAARRMFHHFTQRMERLSSHTQMLREYSMQVREIYQAQVDTRQNQIMKVLTVVTTIFLPLTLIAGWYGMNFAGMPELHWPFGYPLVILISIAVVVISFWFFKKKKYF